MKRAALLLVLVLCACGGDDDGGGGGGPGAADAAPGIDGAPGEDGGRDPDAGPQEVRALYYYWGDVESDGIARVGRVDHDAGSRELLELEGLAGGAQITAVAVAPGGELIAVAGRDTAGGQLQVNLYAGGGGAPTALFTGSRGDEAVTAIAFSPDGARIALRGDLESAGENALYVAPVLAGEEPLRVSHEPVEGRDVEGFFWADARTLVFTGDTVADQVTGLYAVDVAAGSPAPVALVPDGALAAGQEVRRAHGADAEGRVYFTSTHEEPATRRLYRVGLAGDGLEQVPGSAIDDGGEAEIGAFGLSPAGDRVAFAARGPEAESDAVYVLDLASGGAEAILVSAVTPSSGSGEGGLREAEPIRFAPDGASIAVAADYQLAAARTASPCGCFRPRRRPAASASWPRRCSAAASPRSPSCRPATG